MKPPQLGEMLGAAAAPTATLVLEAASDVHSMFFSMTMRTNEDMRKSKIAALDLGDKMLAPGKQYSVDVGTRSLRETAIERSRSSPRRKTSGLNKKG